jgi:Ca2+-binding EF-hand superfamily protein
MSDFDARAIELFNKYDSNNNGVLEKKEFACYFKEMTKLLGESVPEAELEAIVNEGIEIFDLNSDGVLQIEEFKKMLKFLIEEKGLKL